MGVEAPRTFYDLAYALLETTREDPAHTATLEQAKRYLNEANYELHMDHGEKLPWAIREGVLVTKGTYGAATGDVTCSVTQGSTTVALSAAPSNDVLARTQVTARDRIKFPGSDDAYVIKSRSSTAVVLDRKYTGETKASGTEFLSYTDQYPLPQDFQRPVEFTSFDDHSEIPLVGRTDFRRRAPRNVIPGSPRIATIIDVGSSEDFNLSSHGPYRAVRLAPPPSTIEQIPYSYVTKNLAYSNGAIGWIYFLVLPQNGDTITIDGVNWTFVTSGATGNQTNIQSTTQATIEQLAADLNASSDTTINDFSYAYEGVRASQLGSDATFQSLYYPALRISADSPGPEYEVTLASSRILNGATAMQLHLPKENMVGDQDEPIVPLMYRSALVDLAAYKWYLHKKDDQRAQVARADADRKLASLIENNEIGQQRPRLSPVTSPYRRSARQPWRPGRTGRYDINGRFDRLEDR